MMNKWLRRKRNSLGYGVQSPNDFYFIQHVLREKSPYYGYEVLEDLGRGGYDQTPSYPCATNRLLFRLANHVHPETIIEVGAGISAIAMAMACPSARCIAITTSETCHDTLRSLSGDTTIEVKKGDEIGLFSHYMHLLGTIGILHVAHTAYYREIVDTALPYTTDRSLIVIEDIHSSEEKHKWWKELQKNELTGITYDLKTIGLIFFDRSRHKNAYWINLKK